MAIICDTHVLLFLVDQPQRLSQRARAALEHAQNSAGLACADISLWEIGMLYARGRINPHAGLTLDDYLSDLVLALELHVLPITPKIAALAQDPRFNHGDPADRLIAATALVHELPLVSADTQLQRLPGLQCIW
jgi:PIN domain nuclease of toxin-antitoxin system